MIPFLEKIADRLLNKFQEDMEGALIVLPSKRAVVFLKYYLSKKINKPIFLPDFSSVEDFIVDISGLTVLDNTSLQFRLYSSYKSSSFQDKDSFDLFLKWSSMMLNDFNDIDRSLVDAKSVYSNLKSIKELENWGDREWSLSDGNLTYMQKDYINFFNHMYSCYKDFTDKLLENNLAYQGLAYRTAAEKITHIDITWSKIWFVGLNALTKSEQEIIDYLKQKDIARVFWDADSFYYENKIHEAGSFLRNQRERWSEIDFKGVGDYYSSEKKNIQIISCPKNISQSKAASEILRDINKNDLEYSNTAVVLADESLLFPVLNNLPSEVKQLNVTMGSPFKHTTLYSFIDSIFRLQINAIDYQKRSFYYKDFFEVIHHPYFNKLFDKSSVNELKKNIRNNNIVFVDQSLIRKHFPSNKKLLDFFVLWEDPTVITLFFLELVKSLRCLLIGLKGTIESEVLSIFYNNILIIQRLLIESEFKIEVKTMQIIINQLTANEIIPFQGEPLKGVQIMGILETRTLDFKNVIMLSVNEGILPKGKYINSFIPYELRKYFNLPTYEDRDALFSYHFYRLLQRAKNVSLIYNSETDDFGSGERSRFITQLLSEYKHGNINQRVFKHKNLKLHNNHEIIIKNKHLINEIKAWADKGVSASSLNKYNNCSLEFYYKYLARINSDDNLEEHVDATMIGTAIHNALDLFYPVGILNKKDIEKQYPLVIDSIINYFKREMTPEAMKEGKNYLSLEIAKKLTQNFFSLEKQMLDEANRENKQINILATEAELENHLTIDGIKFRLIGKVDRIDSYGDQLRIIDYKTGKVTDSDVSFLEYDDLTNNPKKAKAFQLLMYAYLYLKLNPSLDFQSVIAGNISFKNIKNKLIKISKKINSRTSKTLLIDDLVLESFEKQIKSVLQKIVNEDFTQTDDIKSCEWCDYKSVCNR